MRYNTGHPVPDEPEKILEKEKSRHPFLDEEKTKVYLKSLTEDIMSAGQDYENIPKMKGSFVNYNDDTRIAPRHSISVSEAMDDFQEEFALIQETTGFLAQKSVMFLRPGPVEVTTEKTPDKDYYEKDCSHMAAWVLKHRDALRELRLRLNDLLEHLDG